MANNTVKRVLILYNPKSEHTSDIIDHFCDALNAAKPYGCVKVSPDDDIVEFSENEREAIKERFVKWLEVPNNIVVVCISSSIPREDFTKDQGQLRSKIFPVCFGNKIPSHWLPGECYSLGLADTATINEPNQFKGDGWDMLMAAIRGAK